MQNLFFSVVYLQPYRKDKTHFGALRQYRHFMNLSKQTLYFKRVGARHGILPASYVGSKTNYDLHIRFYHSYTWNVSYIHFRSVMVTWCLELRANPLLCVFIPSAIISFVKILDQSSAIIIQKKSTDFVRLECYFILKINLHIFRTSNNKQNSKNVLTFIVKLHQVSVD
jgi:hypothetical protein